MEPIFGPIDDGSWMNKISSQEKRENEASASLPMPTFIKYLRAQTEFAARVVITIARAAMFVAWNHISGIGSPSKFIDIKYWWQW